uniref:Uncharacterized protein MANES_05G197500 n=1 Tax=Rhizophora mucronata TaxID=61149 RepID=A0A2P2KDL1_RHIMU
MTFLPQSKTLPRPSTPTPWPLSSKPRSLLSPPYLPSSFFFWS